MANPQKSGSFLSGGGKTRRSFAPLPQPLISEVAMNGLVKVDKQPLVIGAGALEHRNAFLRVELRDVLRFLQAAHEPFMHLIHALQRFGNGVVQRIVDAYRHGEGGKVRVVDFAELPDACQRIAQRDVLDGRHG